MTRIRCIACVVATLGGRSYADRQAAASTYEIYRTPRKAAERLP